MPVLRDKNATVAVNPSPGALARERARQHLNLSVGVGGTLGGALLLASNIVGMVAAGASSLSVVPLVANTALIIGGAMFLREYRRGRLQRHGFSQRPVDEAGAEP